MCEILLAEWQFTSAYDSNAYVIPDGCRDLIMRLTPGEKPDWFISSLAGSTCGVPISAGVIMRGFRLQPGVQFCEEQLLACVVSQPADSHDILSRLADSVRLSVSVTEALECLASDVETVAQAAYDLGVSPRSLQRLLARETGQPPVFWFQLARVRKSARAIMTSHALADTASRYGYADQAHMSREFRRWLGVSPANMRTETEIQEQLQHAGYA
jgi:AraC-like DNA-binding protein